MVADNDFRPKLRNVDPIQVVVEGRPAIGLSDPLHLTEGTVCLGREALGVLALLDGNNSITDIQAALIRKTGSFVYSDEIKALVDHLDQALLLEGDRFREAYAAKVSEYRKSVYRPASHAGLSYSGDPEALKAELDGFFSGSKGPGFPNYFSDSRRPAGLVAPHIDMRAGGTCFAHGYHALASGQPSDLYVIFGTGHAGVERLFTATNPDFETPLGRVETDREFLAELEKELAYDPCAEEILHQSEHVIEFQAVMLQYVFGGRHKYKIVPILVALSPVFFTDNPRFDEQRNSFERFCRALKEVLRRSGKSACFVASADLDHIGPRYGDVFVPRESTVNESMSKDREMIGLLERMDLDAFIRYAARENDSRRICGFSPITAMLRCMEAGEGVLLDLDFTHVDNQNSFVTFCSVIFH